MNSFIGYSESILESLHKLITGYDSKELQNASVLCVGSCAHIMKHMFLKYYEIFMPTMIEIIENAKTDNLQKLRGSAMECIGLCGEAVGVNRFMNDAHELMKVLLNIRNDIETQNNNECVLYMNNLFARINRTIGNILFFFLIFFLDFFLFFGFFFSFFFFVVCFFFFAFFLE